LKSLFGKPIGAVVGIDAGAVEIVDHPAIGVGVAVASVAGAVSLPHRTDRNPKFSIQASDG
jgi:hypothetical protein